MPARTLDLMLGLWLFVSAFAWPREAPEFANAWLVGLACAVCSVVAMYSARARYVVTTLSAWLVAAAFLLPHRLGRRRCEAFQPATHHLQQHESLSEQRWERAPARDAWGPLAVSVVQRRSGDGNARAG